MEEMEVMLVLEQLLVAEVVLAVKEEVEVAVVVVLQEELFICLQQQIRFQVHHN